MSAKDIERLAKTLATLRFDAETTLTLKGQIVFFEGTAVDAVRAILQAMREPSEGMIRASTDKKLTNPGYTGTLAVWQAMIDHLLSEGG